VLAGIQRRTGPNIIGVYGLFQPIADALKLLFKEMIIPSLSNKVIFIISPVITFMLSLIS
jgi:NADH-quinone oxidoreductase subunit H